MLKVNALKIRINTSNGLYGLDVDFSSGLNIIKGANSSGKSTIFQSILYCLGLEELLGSRNDKAMQSVLKTEILNDQKVKEADVIESTIFLEIENKSVITIERSVRNENRDPKLIKVYDGALITKKVSPSKVTPMYVHDAGAATDELFGFHAFLEEFLGFNLPEVQYNDNALRKLYLQNIFPAFVIEQKVGWSDFLATIPYYNLKDKEKRAIEFILNLDSWGIEELKQNIRQNKQDIASRWSEKVSILMELGRRSACEIVGIEQEPFIINDIDLIYFTYPSPDKNYLLQEYIDILEESVDDLESQEIPRIEEISSQMEQELNNLGKQYNQFSLQFDLLINKRNSLTAKVSSIEERLVQIEEELYQNKQHQKLKKYGSETNLSIAKDNCPTCGQTLNDSLLPPESLQIPMNISENIGYLEAQRAMAKSYLNNHRSDLSNCSKQILSIENYISQIRDRIRLLKKDLISDGRLPSIELIERRIKLKNRLEFYNNIQKEFEERKLQLFTISKEWEEVKKQEAALPKDSFSRFDYLKLKELESQFIRLLEKFGYGSKSLSDLKISKEKLIPVAENYYNIKFDSSASDLVRAIAAFSCCLYIVSNLHKGNHPSFFMFDEPGTQDTANSTLRELFAELQGYNAQTLIFASFKQSKADFEESTIGIKYKLIESKGYKYIRKIPS